LDIAVHREHTSLYCLEVDASIATCGDTLQSNHGVEQSSKLVLKICHSH